MSVRSLSSAAFQNSAAGWQRALENLGVSLQPATPRYAGGGVLRYLGLHAFAILNP